MRTELLVAAGVVLALTGCGRAARATQLRAEALHSALTTRSFGEPPEQALEKIREVAPLQSSCDGEGCTTCLVPPQLFDPVCIALVRESAGTRVEIPTAWWVDEAVVRRVWRALDAPSLERALATQEEVADRTLADEEARFGTRIGLTGGLHVGIGDRAESVNLGGRLGARWWHTPFLLTAYVVEYDHIYLPRFEWVPTGTFRGEGNLVQVQEDLVAATFRVESGRFTAWSERNFGAPEVSVAVLGSATVLLTQDGPRPGWRLGFGAYFNHYSAAFSVPIFCELTRTGILGLEVHEIRAACGVGL